MMQEFRGRFSFPTDILFEPGARYVAAGEIAAKGSHALLVTDQGVRAAGLADEMATILGKVGLACTIFDDCTPNPTEADVLAGLEAYRSSNADMIIGLGGGSPLDVAKLIALLVNHRLPLKLYADASAGARQIDKAIPPLIAVPTTAGTGSEVSRSAVVTLAGGKGKTVIFSPRLLPILAVCDPELTVGLPAGLTAATGADALTHAVEAFMAQGFHPLADSIALQAVEYVFRYLRRAVGNPSDMEARSAMMLASTMGAVAFQKGLGACHSMAHPLSNIHGLHHGTANAICLPSVLALNAASVGNKVERLEFAIGNALSVNRRYGLPAGIRELFREIGLPASLRSAGVEHPEWALLAKAAMSDACHLTNPRVMNEETFETLFREVA